MEEDKSCKAQSLHVRVFVWEETNPYQDSTSICHRGVEGSPFMITWRVIIIEHQSIWSSETYLNPVKLMVCNFHGDLCLYAGICEGTSNHSCCYVFGNKPTWRGTTKRNIILYEQEAFHKLSHSSPVPKSPTLYVTSRLDWHVSREVLPQIWRMFYQLTGFLLIIEESNLISNGTRNLGIAFVRNLENKRNYHFLGYSARNQSCWVANTLM